MLFSIVFTLANAVKKNFVRILVGLAILAAITTGIAFVAGPAVITTVLEVIAAGVGIVIFLAVCVVGLSVWVLGHGNH